MHFLEKIKEFQPWRLEAYNDGRYFSVVLTTCLNILKEFLCGEKVPISHDQIRKATQTDPELNKVFRYTRDGWEEPVPEELKSYFRKYSEISIDQEVLLWGYRMIIPIIYRKDLLDELHSTHIGMSKMKAVARQYFWWPKLDSDIEQYCRDCEVCRTFPENPEKTTLKKYEDASSVFERFYIDFLGPFKGKVYFILMDAYSKWAEVFEMNSITPLSTIEVLREIFGKYGLSTLVISDNGSQLISEEMKKFFKNNGIQHRTSPPYHPQTNGLAENGVGNFKDKLNKALQDKRNVGMSTRSLINRFLATYRNAPHTTTWVAPAVRMFNRYPKTRWSLLSSDKKKKIRDSQQKYFHGHREVSFEEGEKVYIKDYSNPSKPTWCKAEVKDKLGEKTFLCEPNDKTGWITKRHSDQMIKNGSFYREDFEKINEGSWLIVAFNCGFS